MKEGAFDRDRAWQLGGGRGQPAEPGLRVLNDIDYEIFAKREG